MWPFAQRYLCLLSTSLLFYHPRSPGTDLTRVTSGEVQHVEEEAQLTCQAELLLAKVVLD